MTDNEPELIQRETLPQAVTFIVVEPTPQAKL